MTPFLLDTDILTLFQESHPAVVRQVLQHFHRELAVTVLTVEEQVSGWYTRLRRAKNPDDLAAVYERLASTIESFALFRILPFSKPAILRFQQLYKLKLGVAKMDLRIAAVALESGGILVTRNQSDFQRVPGLTIVDRST